MLKEAIPLPRWRFKTERRGGALVYEHEVCGLTLVHVLWQETKSESSSLCLQMPEEKRICALVSFCNLSGENKFAPAHWTKRLPPIHSNWSRIVFLKVQKILLESVLILSAPQGVCISIQSLVLTNHAVELGHQHQSWLPFDSILKVSVWMRRVSF